MRRFLRADYNGFLNECQDIGNGDGDLMRGCGLGLWSKLRGNTWGDD